MKSAVNAVGGALGQGLATVGQVSQTVTSQVAQGTQKVLVKPAQTVVQQAHQVAVQPLTKAVGGAANKVGEFVTGSSSNEDQPPLPTQAAESSALSTQMALPPDEQVVAMDMLFTKLLSNLSPTDWYERYWEDPQLHTDFFQASGKEDVDVSPWQPQEPETNQTEAPTQSQILNPYDKETYSHRRTVRYHFDKTIMGRTVSPQVYTQQYLRLDKDRCVVALSTDCEGVPFADAFTVYLRWVGTRMGKDDLLLQLGMFVMFKKSVLVAGQIKSTARSESMEEQLQWYEEMKRVCGAQESTANVAVAEEAEEESPGTTAAAASGMCPMPDWKNLGRICAPPPPPAERPFQDDLDRAMGQVRSMLHILAHSGLVEEQRATLMKALGMVHTALDAILVRRLHLEDTTSQAKAPAKDTPKSSLFETSLVKNIASPIEQINSVVIHRVAKTAKKVGKLSITPFLSLSNSATKNITGTSNTGESPEHAAPSGLDDGLQSMVVVVSKVFHNTTMDDLYNLLLSRQKTGLESFYETWLRNSGMQEISIGEWEKADKGEQFVDPWNEESYSQKRTITFQKPRTSSSFVSQLDSSYTLNVQQTQYARYETKKLVSATMERISGTFYSPSVKIFRRLVVTHVDETTLSFKVGIFVMFTQPLLQSSKIVAEETHETRQLYLDLFRVLRASQNDDKVSGPTKERYEFHGVPEEDKPPFLVGLWENVRRILPLTRQLQDDPEFAEELKSIGGKLQMVDEILYDREANRMEDLNFYVGELVIAREALDGAIAPSL